MVERPSARTWIWYSLLRVGVFAALFGVLWFLTQRPWLAALLAAAISACISILFLSAPRRRLARDLEARRRGERADDAAPTDDEAEDAAVEASVHDREGGRP